MADMLFVLVGLLAVGGAIANFLYVVRHWRRERWIVRLIQGIACGYVAVVMALDAGSITDMAGLSGYFLLFGLALVLSASVAEGIIDL